MITKIYLSPNDELKPAIISFDEEKQDFIYEQIPDGLTRGELSELHDEVWRITDPDTYKDVIE